MPWEIVEEPDVDEDGFLDLGGGGMTVRDPQGRLYSIIAPDICYMDEIEIRALRSRLDAEERSL